MITLGQKVRHTISGVSSNSHHEGEAIAYTGRVVYIHEAHKWYLAEFDFGGGKILEAYPFPVEPMEVQMREKGGVPNKKMRMAGWHKNYAGRRERTGCLHL